MHVTHYNNHLKKPNGEFVADERALVESILDMIAGELPSGSGIDGDWHAEMSSSSRMRFSNGYHCINEHGFYEDWAYFTVIIDLDDREYFRLMFHGDRSQRLARRHQLREYLEDIIYESIDKSIGLK